MQTGSQRFQLTAFKPKDSLSPDQSVDDVISYEVKELGTHMFLFFVFITLCHKLFYLRKKKKQKKLTFLTKFINVCITFSLICAVTYSSASGEKLYMRRFYKFQA